MAKRANVKIHVGGIYPLSHFDFNYENDMAYKTYFTQEMLEEGFLASTGFYASYSHTPEIVENYLEACGRVFLKIAEVLKLDETIEDKLKGYVCHSGFQRLN